MEGFKSEREPSVQARQAALRDITGVEGAGPKTGKISPDTFNERTETIDGAYLPGEGDEDLRSRLIKGEAIGASRF